jgi:hypothetical protein
MSAVSATVSDPCLPSLHSASSTASPLMVAESALSEVVSRSSMESPGAALVTCAPSLYAAKPVMAAMPELKSMCCETTSPASCV